MGTVTRNPVGAVAPNGPSAGEARAVEGNRPYLHFRGHWSSEAWAKDSLRNPWLKKFSSTLALLGAGLALLSGHLPAADPARDPARELAELSIEELMNVTVTSVSKHEQRLGDAAAAIAVLSSNDIRRSGATTIPDALRWVPGVNVGGVHAREWAVSARGFNDAFANKLLVLVDGRAVYTPLFSGVFWDLQQTMLEDVDRIEVIRGPGATIWGANAVNGVINVVTASARDTQGTLVYAGGGDVHRALAGWRHGGQVGEHTYYRVFASYESNADWELPGGGSDQNHWQGRHGGFRLDHYPDTDTQLTWQTDATRLDSGTVKGDNINTLVHWTRHLAPYSGQEVQVYYDRVYRKEDNRGRGITNIFDFTAHRDALGSGGRNEMTWGIGYRFIANDIRQTTPLLAVRDNVFNYQLFSAFAQDEWQAVPDRLILTAGLKLEHNDFAGLEFQPSVRAAFKPTETQTVWAAVSRAVRTPSEIEGHDLFAIIAGEPAAGPDGRFYFPAFVGDPTVKSEVLWAYELGYRTRSPKRVGVDLAGYYHRYADLIGYGSPRNFVPGVPFNIVELPWQNIHNAHSYGGEIAVTVSPVETWRLTLNYTLARLKVSGPILSANSVARPPPRHQASLHSALDFSRQASLDVQLRYVDDVLTVPAYFTADVRLAYRLKDGLELSLVGQNLFDPDHQEEAAAPITIVAEVPRGYYGKLTWRF